MEDTKTAEASCNLNSTKVSKDENARAKLYKYNGILTNQEHRRQILLEEIKTRRNDVVDQKRNLQDILNEKDEDLVQDEEPMDVERHRSNKKFVKLMLSEWLCEVPNDLECNWFIKLSPEGQRRLVVASKCNTIAYNKYGGVKNKFQSQLPGGYGESNSRTFTVIDCIYNFHTKTYYVLDILVWNSHSLLKCSADFRFFFLRSKIDETPELNQMTSFNQHKFVHVPFFPAELNLIEENLSKTYEIDDVQIRLDGVLFYYKEMFYRRGFTPFVGWLKPYMIPEVLNVPVAVEYMDKKPASYVSFVDHIEKLQQYNKRLKKEVNNAEEVANMEH